MTIQDIREIYEAESNKQQAVKMSAYMRDQFHFHGIPSPQRKMIFREVHALTKNLPIESIKSLALNLWQQDEREYQYTAMELLDKHKKKLNAKDLAIGETLVTTKSWWDTVDYLSTHFFYPILSKMSYIDRKKHVEFLTKHKDMWMNRIGIIYQLSAKDKTETDLLEIAILPHINSQEFFHQKAIGWALRQYSKFNPSYVRHFIGQHDLKPLSIREASKYL